MTRANLMWEKTKQAISIVSLKPINTSTVQGRSKERSRRIILTALASALGKGVNVLTALISVPLTVKYLGTERYGLWMTISSIIAIIGFADLGMGNGLLNAISEANGKDDQQLGREYTSSAFFMLMSVAIIFAIIFMVIFPLISWKKVFNVSSALAVAEAGPGMAVFIGCFLVNMPLGIVQRIQLGYQEGFINNLWQGLGNVLGLGCVLLAIYLKAGLPWLILAMAGAPVLATLLNGIILLRYRRRWLLPKWGYINSKATKKIFRIGIMFFALQVATALAYSSDNIVTTQVLGPTAVANYAIAMRLYVIPTMILSMILYPLWPAYGESVARGDVMWIKKTLVNSLIISIIITVLPSIVLIIFGIPIVKLWVGPEVTPSFLLLLGLGVWTVIGSAGNAVAMFLNGANIIGFQVVTAIIMSIGAILAKIALSKAIGLPGIIWGTVIAYALLSGIPQLIYVPQVISKMTRNFTTQ
jgi:O-antigen/teichoic acid export membrane protein